MKARHISILALGAQSPSYRWIARDLSLSKNTVAAIVGRARVDTLPDIKIPVWAVSCPYFRQESGSQYCSYDSQKKLQACGLRRSMSGKCLC